MGRVTSRSGGYGHHISYLGWGVYRVSWLTDTKHGKIRHPHRRGRDSDRAGAERFAKKWGCALPEKPVEE